MKKVSDNEEMENDNRVTENNDAVVNNDEAVPYGQDNSQLGATVQTSVVGVPMVCYVPLQSKSSPVKTIESNDDATKFYWS